MRTICLVLISVLLLAKSSFSQTTNWAVYSHYSTCTTGGYLNLHQDANGNIYQFRCNADTTSIYSTSGVQFINAPGQYGSIFVKIDSLGNLVTAGYLGGPNQSQFLYSWAVAPNGNMVVAMGGDSATLDIDLTVGVNAFANPLQQGIYGWVLVMYDNNLNVLNTWTDFTYVPDDLLMNNSGFTAFFQTSGAIDVELGPGTNFIAKAPGYFYNNVIATYDNSGNFQNSFGFSVADSLGFPPLFFDFATLAYDESGNFLLSGSFPGQLTALTQSGTVVLGMPGNTDQNLFVLKANPSGQIQFIKNWNAGGYNGLGFNGEVNTDANNNIYLHFLIDSSAFDLDPDAGVVLFPGQWGGQFY